MSKTKSHAQPRRLVVTVDYHFTTPGRRLGLPARTRDRVLRSIERRLLAHGSIEIDRVEVRG